MSKENNIEEDIKYLIRRSKEVTFLLKDAKYIDAYNKNLGINQKLAHLQSKIESGEIEICDSDCPKESSGERMIKYGDAGEVEKKA